MFPIAAAGSFCEQIFLDPTKMKIYVQGSEVEPAKILSSLEEKETFGIDIFDFLEQDEIIDSALEGRIAVSEERGPAPPYNIAVHVSLGLLCSRCLGEVCSCSASIVPGPLENLNQRLSGATG